MDGAWLAAGHFAAAALMLLLAGVMLWIDAANRAVRAFVAVLVLRSGVLVSQAVAFAANPLTATALGEALIYYDLGIAGATLWFITLYPRRLGALPRIGALLSTIVLLGIWVLEPCWMTCGDSFGPLYFLFAPSALVAGVAAAVLALVSREIPVGPRRTSVRIVAIAFAFDAAVGAGISLGFAESRSWPWLVGAALAALATLATSLRGTARTWVVFGFLLAIASCAFAGRALGNERLVVYGAWRLAGPLLIAYALARHRLLDLDIKVKLAARRTTIGAIFAGVFFVVTEGGAYALGSQFGMIAGIVAVGALVPLMGPLRRAAERVTAFLPGEEGAPRELPIERRRQIYHDFALQAWADGILARQERAFLDQLRERLALPAEDALRLESEAANTNLNRTG